MLRLISTILLFSLTACATNNPFNFPNIATKAKPVGLGVRAGAGASIGNLAATQIVQKSRTTSVAQQEDFDGDGSRYKVEVFKSLARKDALEVGLYASRGSTDYEGEDVETETFGLSLRGFMRDKGVRPYIEVRGGYRTTEQGSVVPGSPDIRLSGDGWTAGLGIGVEVPVTDYLGLFLQLDADYAEVDIGPAFSGNTTEIGLLLGGTVRF